MGAQVLAQVGGAEEGLAAAGAGVGPHAGVDALVLAQPGPVGEAFAALGAVEGAQAGVQPLVLAQVVGRGEGLPALRAGGRPGGRLRVLSPLVAPQRPHVAEGGPAEAAAVPGRCALWMKN